VANYVRDVLAAHDRDDLALITLAADGARTRWTFGELLDASARLAGHLHGRGVGRGSIVMTLLGNRIEYPLTMLACLHLADRLQAAEEDLAKLRDDVSSKAREFSLLLDEAIGEEESRSPGVRESGE